MKKNLKKCLSTYGRICSTEGFIDLHRIYDFIWLHSREFFIVFDKVKGLKLYFQKNVGRISFRMVFDITSNNWKTDVNVCSFSE